MSIVGYTVSYSFAGWQAVNPTEPLPAQELDAQLAAIAESLASVVLGVGQVRRSDGKLQNGVVTYDSLDAQMKARLDGEERVLIMDLAPEIMASQAEAEDGDANDKLMTPLRTAQAIVEQRPMAGPSEAEEGISTTALLSAAQVRDGVLRWLPFAAGQAQVNSDTIVNMVMNPKTTRESIRALRRSIRASYTLTWGTITADDAATITLAHPGAQLGDRVLVGPPAEGIPAGLVLSSWVPEENKISIRLYNASATSKTPTAALVWFVTTVTF